MSVSGEDRKRTRNTDEGSAIYHTKRPRLDSPGSVPGNEHGSVQKRPASCRPNAFAKDSSKAQARINQIQEAEQMREWVSKEDEFMLQQTKKKARIRVREGRATNIDKLVVTLIASQAADTPLDGEDEEDIVGVDIVDPVKLLEQLSPTDIRDLEKDIAPFIFLEKRSSNRKYWTAIQAICRQQIRKAGNPTRDGRMATSVALEIDRLLGSKSLLELDTLLDQVKRKLQSDEPIDVEYWEQLQQSIDVCKARAELDNLYCSRFSKEKKLLKPPSIPSVTPLASTLESNLQASSPAVARFAPTPSEDFSQATKALYDREVARGIQEDEEIFASEENLNVSQTPQWASKYRPRKPRYFNRVQMGYEWNKYNQTHYDHDNPPPKVVQGYKFNVFYPDLIDKMKAPTYRIEREHGRKRGQSFAPAGEEDTCLIRFMSGPPYEDLAFRIVDKEWDFSAKRERGFRSSFDKGILQLHFSFKKVYYRK